MMKLETRNLKLGAVIPSSRLTPANLKAECDMFARHASIKVLNPLPTEILARKYRKEKHKQIDALAKRDRRKAATGSTITIAALAIMGLALYLTIGLLACASF
jgi:hypothetical protein